MLFNIQVLRAIAALLVVHAHVAHADGFNLAWDGGSNGVDLFFVISGFIIAYVAALDSDQFVKRRLVRIVPIYWSCTLGLYALVLVMPNLFRSTSSDPELLVRSLLFVPDGSSVHGDGIPHPTLNAGWTLNYEMYFYMMFALALALSKRWATTIAIGLLLAVITVVNVTSLQSSAVAMFYGEPIIFEFAFGILAFQALRAIEAGVKRGKQWRPPKLLLYLGIVIGLVCIAFTKELFPGVPRWISTGIPSFFTVLAAVLLERLHDIKVTNKVAIAIGDASYVLYLIHAYVIAAIVRLALGGRQFSELGGQLMTVAIGAVCVAASVAVYAFYEKPLLRVLKRWIIRPKARTAAVATAAVVVPPT